MMMMGTFFTVGENVTPKRCKMCGKKGEEETDFYCSCGAVRGECKECSIKRSYLVQKREKSWLERNMSEDRSVYMKEYYQKNKERFARNRKAFVDNNPNYYREYYHKRKLAQNNAGDTLCNHQHNNTD